MESGGPLARSDPRDGRGGWRAALFIVAVGFLERIGFIGVGGYLITYLTGPLGMSTAAAAAGVNAWSGTVLVLPLVGALAADSRLGRYRAVLLAGVLYLLSLGMLTVSSMLQTRRLHPAECHGTTTTCSTSSPPAQLGFFYTALYLLALAQGFHKPCSEALGADQFDSSAGASRSSYFNWFHFSMSWGYAIAATAVTYTEENVGWTAGFAACWAIMVVYLAVFLLGRGTYRVEQPVDGSSFGRLTDKLVFSRTDATIDTQRLLETNQDAFLVKLLPIWLSSLVFAACISQITTLFTKQGSTMDRRLGGAAGLVVPPAALQCCISFTFIVLVPVYDRAIVPFVRRLTGHPGGITMLQRIGAGMVLASVTMVVAALVEAKRLRVAEDAGLLDRPDVAVPMSLNFCSKGPPAESNCQKRPPASPNARSDPPAATGAGGWGLPPPAQAAGQAAGACRAGSWWPAAIPVAPARDGTDGSCGPCRQQPRRQRGPGRHQPRRHLRGLSQRCVTRR